MPAMAHVPIDFNKYEGRGWEPERTYHTPRSDARSAKSQSGRWVPHSERTQPDWYGTPGVPSTRAGGRGGHFSPSMAGRRPPPFVQRCHDGFDPDVRPLHGERESLPWEAPLRRSMTPPPSSRRWSSANDPLAYPTLMDGRVTLGGRAPDKNLHHRPGYESPDRALVGDEEAAARAKADKERLRARLRPSQREGGLGDAAKQARMRALAAAERRRVYVPLPSTGLTTNKTHGTMEPELDRVATPTTMSRASGY
jgi:hypothetical protein